MTNEKQHPLNAPGPFYVENECCTSCGVPEHIAPDLFGSDDDDHCYVKRQPGSSRETTTMLRVIATQELSCVRYRGTDEAVVLRIAEMGEAGACDTRLPDGLKPQRRNRVSFRAPASLSPRDLLDRFFEFLVTRPQYDLKRMPVVIDGTRASMSVSWFEDRYHRIDVTREPATNEWVLIHQGPVGLSMAISDWLEAENETSAQDWRSGADVENGVPRMTTPW